MAKTAKRKKGGRLGGFPTLGDLKIPKGGLLDPSLRKGFTGGVPTAKQILGKNPYARR